MAAMQPRRLLPSFLLLLLSLTVASGAENPFTPRAFLIRYWNSKIYKVPRSDFLLSKSSPLSASDAASFAFLASNNSLSTRLPSFCTKAHLLCFPEPSPSLAKHSSNVRFANYSDRNFTSYGAGRVSGADSFKNYSDHVTEPLVTFRGYSRGSTIHADKFSAYVHDGNVVTADFNTYGTGAAGGSGEFKHYADSVNNPNLKFASYSGDGNRRHQSFSVYSSVSNSGDQVFAGYGKDGNGLANTFNNYGNSSNSINTNFSSYSSAGNGAADNFTVYGQNQNIPMNTFKNYADGGNAVTESFSHYREQGNVGDDSFQSYAKKSSSVDVQFSSYRTSDNFTAYGKGATGQTVGFKQYANFLGPNTFKDYAKDGVTFAKYNNNTIDNNKAVNKWIEPGKFFREENLKPGTVMPMPDIKDKMPPRSFLPRSILSKLPFASSKLPQMKAIFHASDNPAMESMLSSAVRECERPPSPGETKRCVGSAEDMIDFAVSVLGNAVELRTTESTAGSKGEILIGKVKGINAGRVTHSVSCHQSLYPYLLYYCHSVPKVRVYEAEIVDPATKARINRGVAICHLDTSSWSATHGAFLALGSAPGKIEVCHWIFENDLTWTIADS